MDNRARDTRWLEACLVEDGNMESSKQSGVIHAWLWIGTSESTSLSTYTGMRLLSGVIHAWLWIGTFESTSHSTFTGMRFLRR